MISLVTGTVLKITDKSFTKLNHLTARCAMVARGGPFNSGGKVDVERRRDKVGWNPLGLWVVIGLRSKNAATTMYPPRILTLKETWPGVKSGDRLTKATN